MAQKIEGFDSLDAILQTIEDMTPVKAGIAEVALLLKGTVATYPPQRRAPQPFKTAKSRRYFFYAKANNLIDVPYQRGGRQSQALGRRWTLEFENDGLSAVLGNNATYGPLVQGRNTQTTYHRGTGWVTVEDAAEQNAELALRVIKAHVDRALGEG